MLFCTLMVMDSNKISSYSFSNIEVSALNTTVDQATARYVIDTSV